MSFMSAPALGGRQSSLLRVTRATMGRVAEITAVALLTAWAVHAHTRDLAAPLWIDEGISLGIAHHSLTAIPGVLRQDGSPPLFYVLLHAWTGVFGGTVRSGHALSLLLAAAAVPAAWWAAAGVFGPAAGVATAAIVALDPFAGTYAVEIRMYSLLLLLGLLATGTFLRAFVVAPGHRGWAAAFAVSLAAVFYTHNWGLFLGAAAGLAWLGLLAAGGTQRRALLTSGLIGFGGALVLFAPWLPIVLDQARHTGAPWSHAPHWKSVGRAVRRMLGGATPETVLVLFALAGMATAFRTTSPAARRAALATAGLAVGTFVIAYAWSNLSSPAWALRYLSLVLAPAAIVIGAGLARTGPIAAVVLAVLFLGFWYGKPTHSSLGHKSNVHVVARRLGPDLPVGTTVFSTQPEQVPVLWFYLPGGLRYATPLGTVPDPRVMNWRDAMARLDRPAAARVLPQLLAGLRPGERLLLIQPRFVVPTATWTRRIHQLAHVARRAVDRDHHIRIIARVVAHRGYTRATVTGLLLERRS
jgi:hypothetical protein